MLIFSAINAARSIGCVCVNVHNNDLMDGTPTIIVRPLTEGDERERGMTEREREKER
jgi:hypothetical protein